MPTLARMWRELAARQAGIVARRQLRLLDLGADRVRDQVAAERWVVRTPTVVSTTTGPLSRDQLRWLAVLHAGPGALIGGLSAAELHGLRRWHRDQITVLVDDQLAFDPVPGVRFFRTRRDQTGWRDRGLTIPTARIEPAILLFAGYEPHLRTALGALSAVVQQGLTTPTALRDQLELMRPLRRARHFRAALADMDGGSQSLAEIDVVRMCRAEGLELPRRQTRREDRAGRLRYTDAEWVLADGRRLVLEVDGAFHMEVEHWEDDLRRQRALTQQSVALVRCTARELRYEPAQIAADLRALGVPEQ